MGRRTITVRAGFEPSRSHVTIEVQDDGPGIPAYTVTRLFRRDGLNAVEVVGVLEQRVLKVETVRPVAGSCAQ